MSYTRQQESEAIGLVLRKLRAEAEEAEARRDRALEELKAAVSVAAVSAAVEERHKSVCVRCGLPLEKGERYTMTQTGPAHPVCPGPRIANVEVK